MTRLFFPIIVIMTVSCGAQETLRLPAAWDMSPPLVQPEQRQSLASVAMKDPTFVFHENRWHLFATIKCEGKTLTEYLSFEKWETANAAARTVLDMPGNYACAPQVFYFRPQRKWYLIYQVGVPGKKFMQVSYSTSENIGDPKSWTPARDLFADLATDPRQAGGLDYWIICDAERAWLFFTSLNGKMWRLWTTLGEFPKGFRDCRVALEGDIFEASHTYRLKGLDKYLTIIEANPGGRRYFKAYIADALGGSWTPLADTERAPFAGAANVRAAPGETPWADNISHGELIRDSNDETLTVDPDNLRFVFQGATQQEKAGIPYGKIPWRLGLLTPRR